jgi:hypothetical protein
MADPADKKVQREAPQTDVSADAEATRRAATDDADPREEEGWTQPESSAQKGAARDEG